jgi:hypothetical protein
MPSEIKRNMTQMYNLRQGKRVIKMRQKATYYIAHVLIWRTIQSELKSPEIASNIIFFYFAVYSIAGNA